MSFLERFFGRPSSPGAQVARPQRVRKAVFPVAGFGTRFLPATKAIPKEMLPIVDRPLIQYAVDEALAAGIEEMIFVTHRTKRAIEDHFDRAVELESELEHSGKAAQLAEVRKMSQTSVRFSFARQPAPLGLGHAIRCARHLIGNEPFAVILPDDLIDGDPPALAQLIDSFSRLGTSVIAIEPVRREETSKYGIIDPAPGSSQPTRIAGIVEKPQPDEAPSTLAVVGRYVFTPHLLDCLENLAPGRGGEIQLTDAIARLLKEEPVHALSYSGTRYDCGSKIGFLEATLAYATRHPEFAEQFQEVILRAAHELQPSEVATGTTGARSTRHLTLVAP